MASRFFSRIEGFGSSASRCGFAWAAVFLAVMGATNVLTAQNHPEVKVSRSAPDSIHSFGWGILAGKKVSRPHVKLGLWALHPFEPQFPELDWVSGFGLKADQWLIATFVNSYDQRAFVAALERYWWVEELGRIDAGVGYRAGLITGYGEELIGWADTIPVLPFIGLLLWADVGPVSIDGFYAYRGITLETGLTFR